MGLKITVYDTDYDTGESIGDPIRILTPDALDFAWDGCHKIYLIRTLEELRKIVDLGYGQGDDDDPTEILPISELPLIWEQTCGLRFISSADLTTEFVSQTEDADVEWEEAE